MGDHGKTRFVAGDILYGPYNMGHTEWERVQNFGNITIINIFWIFIEVKSDDRNCDISIEIIIQYRLK